MIVVDTNVISEVMRDEPDSYVLGWYRATPRHLLFSTAVTVGEILAGIQSLPAGKRRADMELDARAMFAEDFDAKILPFDLIAAEYYGQIIVERRKKGRPIKPLDAEIAAIARARDMSVATRNIGDFEDTGVNLINPWEA
jgi:predicted nucleic acid-binding protein